jgi:hypothetical protein
MLMPDLCFFVKRFLSPACLKSSRLLANSLHFLGHHAHSVLINANDNRCRRAEIEYLLPLMVCCSCACIRPCCIELLPCIVLQFTSSRFYDFAVTLAIKQIAVFAHSPWLLVTLYIAF